jgi:hypothetical protein
MSTMEGGRGRQIASERAKLDPIEALAGDMPPAISAT